ncbi:hypothetical protein BD309DRAFT_248262 [Dichomitus squalens]|nr:hypothetical protein BD309DRAFT_248262 [Dichomitus squalens]
MRRALCRLFCAVTWCCTCPYSDRTATGAQDGATGANANLKDAYDCDPGAPWPSRTAVTRTVYTRIRRRLSGTNMRRRRSQFSSSNYRTHCECFPLSERLPPSGEPEGSSTNGQAGPGGGALHGCG